MPIFSKPTEITNPLFPVSSQASVLLLGQVDDQAFRTEVTLLPETRIIEWQGQRIEVAVSQYVAYLDGQIHEVAYDLYAQADDGSVWYFGEDVYNFAHGAIVDTRETWIAGRDGPAAMIMPADPEVGDVYRPENIPGFVFEEVTVKGVDQTLDGPLGPIEGGLLIEELDMDGSTEEKSFAPGYGEFYTAGGRGRRCGRPRGNRRGTVEPRPAAATPARRRGGPGALRPLGRATAARRGRRGRGCRQRQSVRAGLRPRPHPAHTLDGAAVTSLNATLEELQGAVGDGDFTATAEIAQQLREVVSASRAS